MMKYTCMHIYIYCMDKLAQSRLGTKFRCYFWCQIRSGKTKWNNRNLLNSNKQLLVTFSWLSWPDRWGIFLLPHMGFLVLITLVGFHNCRCYPEMCSTKHAEAVNVWGWKYTFVLPIIGPQNLSLRNFSVVNNPIVFVGIWDMVCLCHRYDYS